MFRYLYIIAALIVFPLSGYTQVESSVWYFGSQYSISFKTGIPTLTAGNKLNTYAGCATVADTAGNLLFYCDGKSIYNRSGSPMVGGTGLEGDDSLAQSVSIVKKPGSQPYYFVFTLTKQGLYYHIVDAAFNTGLGRVISKNNQLPLANPTQKFVVLKDAKGCAYWLVARSSGTNEFYTFRFDDTKVEPLPVISNAGIADNALLGQLKASPDGKKLAATVNNSPLGISYLQLFDFDNSTGKITNAVTLDSGTTINPYGLSFSPNNAKLYCTDLSAGISQFNVSLPANQIAASKQLIPVADVGYSALKTAPNGFLYALPLGKKYLSALPYPDSSYTATGYVQQAIVFDTSAAPIDTFIGLPEFIAGTHPFHAPFSESLTFTSHTASVCGTSVALQPATNTAPYGPYLWNTGDTTKTLTAKQSGIFVLAIQTPCRLLKDSVDVLVAADPGPPPINLLPADTTICHTNPATITAKNIAGANYQWTDGTPGRTRTVTANGKFILLAEIPVCKRKYFDTINVQYHQLIKPALQSQLITPCYEPVNITLNPKVDYKSYLWSTGETKKVIFVSDTGLYTLQAVDACNQNVTGSTLVKFDDCNCALFVPNAITPNHYGPVGNEFFAVYGSCKFETFKLEIFSRTLVTVYSSEDPKLGWKPDTENFIDGLYMFKLAYSFEPEKVERIEYGKFILIR